MINIVLDLLNQTYELEFNTTSITVTRYMPDLHPTFFGLVDDMEAAWVIDAYDNNTYDHYRMYQNHPISRNS
mgnify:CR=1 FL=1|tara:strand:+ start:480 stop:695 length:216 start_codon:yes stop_codon:yes gene_type:complete